MCAPQMPTSGGGQRPFQALTKAILLNSMGANDPRRAAIGAMGTQSAGKLGAPASPSASPLPTLGGR